MTAGLGDGAALAVVRDVTVSRRAPFPQTNDTTWSVSFVAPVTELRGIVRSKVASRPPLLTARPRSPAIALAPISVM